ncbi:MAG: signal peptidase II [Lishizhenia sp.]
MHLNKKHLTLFSVVLLILILDQVVKIWIKSTFSVNDPSVNLIGDWFQLNYTENQGMAFGTTLGGGIWGKLTLSIFRVVAIFGIIYYAFQQIKLKVRTEFVIAIGLVLAGALGNLLDSAFYDFIFTEFDPCLSFNQLEGSGNLMECDRGFGITQAVEARHTGFLLGNVVDMFQFNAYWPEWIPYLGGGQVFPAIWNVADASISLGVIMVVLRQKKYFKKEKISGKTKQSTDVEQNNIENLNETRE